MFHDANYGRNKFRKYILLIKMKNIHKLNFELDGKFFNIFFFFKFCKFNFKAAIYLCYFECKRKAKENFHKCMEFKIL